MYIYHNLGMGDHIICNAIVRNYSNLYKKIYLFVKNNNYENVKYMFRDLKNINYLIGNDQYANNFLLNVNTNNILRINFSNYNTNMKFDECFYKQINMNFEKRWSDFYIIRDMEKEKELFNNLNLKEYEYIFVHDDINRNFIINEKLLSTNIKIIKPDNNYSIFDYQYIIENAKEVHLMESSFKCLVENLNINGRLFYHRYVRDYPSNIESTSKKNWIIYK